VPYPILRREPSQPPLPLVDDNFDPEMFGDMVKKLGS
jgi:hypothetical protein